MYILDIFKIASSAFATRCMILISAPNNHSFLLLVSANRNLFDGVLYISQGKRYLTNFVFSIVL